MRTQHKELEYGFADKAWQVVTGCDNTIACWKNCWAARVVNRLSASPNAKVAAAHAGLVRVAGPAYNPVLAWTGVVRINEAHLEDPLKWRKPAVIATGFHGDWGLLSSIDKKRMFAVMERCEYHQFFPLTKHGLPEHALFLSEMALCRRVLPNVNIGVSVMEQDDADATLPHIRTIAAAGWKVHVWHEPAIGSVDWRGWEFLSWLIVGGQSAGDAPFDLQWARNAIAWGNINHVPIKIKQIGLHPVDGLRDASHLVTDRRGESWDTWPPGIKVRGMPEVVK